MAKILVIDDEEVIRSTLTEILSYEDYEADQASDGQEGLAMILKGDYDVVLCDIKMPKLNGLEVLEKALATKPETQFIMISGHGDIDTAVEATKLGAFDFIQKPPDLNRLLISIRNAMNTNELVVETKKLRRKVSKVTNIVGDSPGISKVKETISKVAPTDARVLITGSNGTGKELVARWLHDKSERASGPMVEVNCAAIPSELIESELFGHEKGSFTGAYKQRVGKFEQANNGTLFMDEIGDMSLSAQAKVLRALQEHKISRIGSDKQIKVNVRILAATNKDLIAEIDAGRFREDLYHRLSVILIHVPPLKDRSTDIPILVDHFLGQIAGEYGKSKPEITAGAVKQLTKQEWSGNVRELHNVIERLFIMCGEKITEQDIHDYAIPQGRRKVSGDIYRQFDDFQEFKNHVEREFIMHKLDKSGWNISKTAELMDIQRSHLYNKMEKFGIKRS